jgi:sigma-B regulation protein RsbU (phosphoserine phosphatase)
MQLSLLPKPDWVTRMAAGQGLHVHSHFETSSELGGDLWTISEIDDHKTGFLMVDFAGHGITAAINTFRLHTLLHALTERDSSRRADPAAWLGLINQELKAILPTGQFATAFYAVVDTKDNILKCAGAGSPNPLLRVGAQITAIDSSGFVLGMSRRASYTTQEILFPPGAVLFLYSDALTECPERLGRMIDIPELAGMMAETGTAAKTPAEGLAYLLEQCLGTISRPLRDDLTAIWVEHA